MGFFNRLKGKKSKTNTNRPKKEYDTAENREKFDNADNYWLDPENFKDHFSWGILSLDDEERLVDIILDHDDLHHRTLAFYRLRNKYKNEIPDMGEYVFQLSDHIGLSLDDLSEILDDWFAYMWARKVFFRQVESDFYRDDVLIEGMKLML